MPRWNELAVIALAAAGIWVGAMISLSLPGTDVPQTGQTLAVLLAGGLLGPWRGVTAVAVYLAAGSGGLPVFAGGASGAGVLVGATGGFLLGFLPAAALAGWAADHRRPGPPSFLRLTGWLLAAHAVILLIGWGRLAWEVGPAAALTAGVTPFLLGAAVKSLAAAAVVVLTDRIRRARGAPGVS